jgi:hypothetical protein
MMPAAVARNLRRVSIGLSILFFAAGPERARFLEVNLGLGAFHGFTI